MKKLILQLAVLILIASQAAVADEEVKVEDAILVKVNGVGITMPELNHFVAKQAQGVDPQRALAEMINVELLAQVARDENAMQDKELALEIKRSTNALLASHYLQKFLIQLEITEDQLRQRYQREYVDTAKSLEYNANHILVKSREEAIDVIAQLDEGASFTELAKSLSVGPSGKSGGELGWFKSGDMVEPFSKAAMQLEPGNYSKEPVETRFGWHIILLNNSRAVTPPEFDAVREKLHTATAAEAISNMLKALHDKSTIEFIEQ